MCSRRSACASLGCHKLHGLLFCTVHKAACGLAQAQPVGCTHSSRTQLVQVQAVLRRQATGTCTQHARPRALAERGKPDAAAAPRAPTGPSLHACTHVSATAVAAGAMRKRCKPHLQGWRALPQCVHAALA